MSESADVGKTGAIPSLDTPVLGVPQGRAKAKSNVTRFVVVGVVLLGLLVAVGGVMLYQKKAKKRAEEAAKVQSGKEAVRGQAPAFAVKNKTVESEAVAARKAAIREKEREDHRKAEAEAADLAVAEAAAAKAQGGATADAPAGAASAPQSRFARQLNRGVLVDTGVSAKPGGAGQDAAPTGGRDPDVVTRLRELGFDANGNPLNAPGGIATPATAVGAGEGEASESRATGYAGSFQGTVFASRQAGRLSNLDWLLRRGVAIPCRLKFGIDTTLAGPAECEAIKDVYSANGAMKLVDRGATFSGEQRSSLAQGQTRAGVIWARMVNPDGEVANLDSPGGDQMGYVGIPGYVDTHFWARFGGAVMISTIRDFSSALAQRKGAENTSNTQQAAEDVATVTLRNSINIPPTLIALPGTIITIIVTRDVSFENVFAAGQ